MLNSLTCALLAQHTPTARSGLLLTLRPRLSPSDASRSLPVVSRLERQVNLKKCSAESIDDHERPGRPPASGAAAGRAQYPYLLPEPDVVVVAGALLVLVVAGVTLVLLAVTACQMPTSLMPCPFASPGA